MVVGAKSGNQRAFDQLFHRWFNEVWNISKSIVNDDETATKLTQITFLDTWRQLHRLEMPSTFGGSVLLAGRQKALNALGGYDITTTTPEINQGKPSTSGDAHLPLSVDTIDEQPLISNPTTQQHLLWAVTETLGEGEASLIDLRLRYGLSTTELAHELDLSNKEVQKKIGEQTNQLVEAVRNFHLWNHGEPRCAKLGALIKGSETYKSSVVRTIKGHHISCGDCKCRRLDLQSADQLFTTIPLSSPPKGAKQTVVDQLAEDGLTISVESDSRADYANKTRSSTLELKFSLEPPPAVHNQPETTDISSSHLPDPADSKITQRLKAIRIDETDTFAQDSPVRYSRRPLTVTTNQTRRSAPGKAVLMSAALLLFAVATIAVIFTG